MAGCSDDKLYRLYLGILRRYKGLYLLVVAKKLVNACPQLGQHVAVQVRCAVAELHGAALQFD